MMSDTTGQPSQPMSSVPPASEATPDVAPNAAPAASPPQTPAPQQPAAAGPAAPTVNDLPADLAQQAEAAMKAASAAPAPKPAIRGPRVVQAGREHRHGRVVSVGPDDIFVEFSPKELGVAKRSQWPEEELPKVNDDLEVVVDRHDANEQLFICSRPGAVQKADWELLQPGQVVEARVTGVNKGGLELEVAGHRAFMPASRVDVHPIADPSVFVGEKLTCKIRAVDRAGKGNIVLSRRELLEQDRKEQLGKLKETLKEGQTVSGVVKKIMPFGAFIDIGGVDGLVHISDLAHDRVHNVESVLKEGQEVTAKILKIDWDANRISLGMKQAMEDPFKSASTQVTAGEEVTGRVTKIMDFGAFIEIAPGVEGLVHISEVSWQRIATVESALKPDEVVKVKVLEVDSDRRRISLSIKQLTEAPASSRKGRGGRGEEGRSEEEIRHETPAQRRLREQFQAKQKGKDKLKSGLGNVEGVGLGELGDLKLG